MKEFQRVLITGVAGFAGSHLARELVASGYQVSGTRLRGESLANLTGMGVRPKIRVLNLCSPSSCEKVLREFQPEAIFHLAAYSAVGASYADPALPMQVNFGGTLNLLEVLRHQREIRRVLQVMIVVGSSDMYGRVRPRDLPLNEEQPLNPVSPYAISKAAADFLAATYYRAYGLPIIRVRAFNHAGPGQKRGFVVPDFAEQVARLEKQSGKRVLKTGNLAARRDITDVRDVACAYRLIAQRGKPGEVYHLGSGKSVAMKSILDKLIKMARRPIKTVPDPRRLRPAEVPVLCADITKLKKLGWSPRFPLSRTLADTLEYYRSLV